MAVVGDRVDGILVRFDVPDVAAIDSYEATLVQIANRDNALRASLNDYRLTVRRAGTDLASQ